ncbi:hypothetical protein DEU56DRAFT_758625 [Suillus clintonianus]|uniref:uncharacterized protein n=1 Tax=Suillus clintonianus TaxID=1904413 RepID=UPI001B85E434|nr:uncharacterized protein DEU56DRAFT_758625 [Suillus clintonianus]KAG2127508.1 hypothetical protein DEU56DRAFT_758625 [Suillus clintonianus]
MNTLYQETRVTLKEHFPARKSRRTAQKKLRITVLESCLPWLFASPRLTAIPVKMAGKKWATPEQEEFLLSFMSEFRESAATKNYDDFFTRIWALWFERWSEERVIFKDMPDDYVRTPDDIKALARAVEMRQQGPGAVLKFDTVLGGGVELKGTRAPQKIDIYSHKFYEAKVKNVADNAITTENITNRGPKLNKRREITQADVLGGKLSLKYRKAKANFAKKRQQLKSGKPLKLDDATKVKAIRELGPMLDRILKYLAHITGGWKFTVLMGGRDPRTGETSVFNYHVGELQSGAQFNRVYKDFDGMQAAFLAFVQNALGMAEVSKFRNTDLRAPQSAFESTLPHDETAEDEDEESSSDWDFDEDNNNRRGKSVEEDMSQVEDLALFDTNNLYRMTPQSASDEILEDHASGSHTTPLDTLLDSALPKAFPTTASQASADASTALGSMAGTVDNSSLTTKFLSHSTAFDPIVEGTADFSAFDPHAFAAIVNNPYFEPGVLDNDWSMRALDTTDKLSDLPAQSPTNLTSPDDCDCPPSNQEMEVLLPAVPSANSEEGQDDDSLLNQPEVHPRRGARRRRVDRSPAPTSSMDPPTLPVHMEMNAPRLRARNNVPFNPRERDNNIGVPARRAHPADSRKELEQKKTERDLLNSGFRTVREGLNLCPNRSGDGGPRTSFWSGPSKTWNHGPDHGSTKFSEVYFFHVKFLNGMKETAPGKFHRLMADIFEAVQKLCTNGAATLSSHDDAMAFLDLDGMDDDE